MSAACADAAAPMASPARRPRAVFLSLISWLPQGGCREAHAITRVFRADERRLTKISVSGDRAPPESARALARRAHDVLDEEREAAGEEDRRAPGLTDGEPAQDERGEPDPGEDAEGKPQILDEQPEDLAGGGNEPFHPTVSLRASGAAAAATARNSAAMPRIARSSPGQWKPRPSPTQNTPNAESSTPTANLSVFSGIRASGWYTTQPATATSTQAARAPTLAGTSSPPAAPTASTMNTTSSPSSTTALNAVMTAIASQPRCGCAARSSAQFLSKTAASSCRATTPAARRIAFLSQRMPKRRSSTPTPSCRTWIGMRASNGPKASTKSARKAPPAAVPASAGRHPRTVRTARTMVSASTASTREPMKAEAIAVPAWASESMAEGGIEQLR